MTPFKYINKSILLIKICLSSLSIHDKTIKISTKINQKLVDIQRINNNHYLLSYQRILLVIHNTLNIISKHNNNYCKILCILIDYSTNPQKLSLASSKYIKRFKYKYSIKINNKYVRRIDKIAILQLYIIYKLLITKQPIYIFNYTKQNIKI